MSAAALRGPADCEANGVAYKIEHEWQESVLILRESADHVPEPCVINMITGDYWCEVEGRTFKYCGSEAGLTRVVLGASPFKYTGIARRG